MQAKIEKMPHFSKNSVIEKGINFSKNSAKAT